MTHARSCSPTNHTGIEVNYLLFSQEYKDLHCMQIFKELEFLFCFNDRISMSAFFSSYSFLGVPYSSLQTVVLESPYPLTAA